MAKKPKYSLALKSILLIAISFGVIWAVMPPGKIAERVIQDVQGKSVELPASTQGFLRELSSELNASLPRRISEDMRLDTTMPGPGNRFTYFYTLLSITEKTTTASQFKNEMAPTLRQRGINSGYLDDFFRDGTTVEFRYADEKGYPVGVITITPEDAGF